MSVSSISGVTLEGQPNELASFIRSGVVHVVWHSPNALGQKKLRWKPHTGLDFVETIGELTADFNNITALYYPSNDSVIVCWDDRLSQFGFTNSTIYTARFNYATGAVIAGPTSLGPGTRPQLMYKNNVPGDVFYMFSFLAKTDDVTMRISTNGGTTWGEAAPVLTNKVLKTTFVEAVAYDDTHVSVAQLGKDPRALAEFGLLKRTRPLNNILKHPTNANQFFIGEPSRITGVAQSDNLRGGMRLSTDNTKIYKLDGDAQGTSDSVGGIALVALSGTTPSVSASTGPNPGASRNRIVEYTLTPTASFTADLDSGLPVISMDVSSTYAYLAQNLESNATAGQLKVVQLSSLTTQSAFLTGISGRAVSVANFLSPVHIFAATTESSVERLRVYTENGTTPTLLANYKLLLRANALFVMQHTANAAWAMVYASTAERLSIYEFRGTGVPLRLVNSIALTGGGIFYKLTAASNGNIIAAAGNAGVLVINPAGKTLAQLRTSGQVVREWTPSTSYSLNALVKTRATHQFSANRLYFKASTAGTSAAMEPPWASTGTISDGSAQWQPVGKMDGVVSDVVIDETLKRIYAVGVAGGDLGTDGRLWVLDAKGLF